MKQKYWKVSVFDKTSEIIRDDTFYTTDTEVYLTFELIDRDFTPDSATVTLYNIYGTVIINACADIVDGILHYEMPVDAIGHLGGWRTQIVFTKDNEDYTTKIIEFDVGGHLLDNKKTPIFVIENWNSFVKHAGNLVDDWEQLEKIRQANERKRERSESVRQKEFETNEDERESTFEINESVRHQHAEERYGQLEEEYAPKLTKVTAQLAQTDSDLIQRAVNIMYPPAPMTAAVGDGETDDSQAIQNILDTYDIVYIPPQKFKASFIVRRTGQYLFGTGRKSVIIPATNDWAVGINAMHIVLKDFYVSLPEDFTGDGIRSQIPNGTNSRFMRFEGVGSQQLGSTNANSAFKLSTENDWTGYVQFIKCHFYGGKNTLDGSTSGLKSMINLQDCVISGSGEFNVKLREMNGGVISNLDTAVGGLDIDATATDNTDLGGGVRLENSHRIHIDGGWSEQIPPKIKGTITLNSISYDEDCSDIIIDNQRDLREGTYGGFIMLGENEATNSRIVFNHDRGGKIIPFESPNLLKNPLLKVEDERVKHWKKGSLTVNRVDDSPKGFKGSLQLINSGNAPVFFTQAIPSDIVRKGNTVTFTIFVKVPKSTGVNENLHSGAIRFGLNRGNGDWAVAQMYRIGQIQGAYNRWTMNQLTYTFTEEDEINGKSVTIILGEPIENTSGNINEVLIAGMSLADGTSGAVFANPLLDELESLKERVELLENV